MTSLFACLCLRLLFSDCSSDLSSGWFGEKAQGRDGLQRGQLCHRVCRYGGENLLRALFLSEQNDYSSSQRRKICRNAAFVTMFLHISSGASRYTFNPFHVQWNLEI